jgi:hypothetical protein
MNPDIRSRRRLRQCVIVLVVALVLGAGSANAARVRGLLERSDKHGKSPAQGVYVTAYSKTHGRSVGVKTDSHGMYYLDIPAGTYWLEIWVSTPARVYQIRVVEPYTDIPPIKL